MPTVDSGVSSSLLLASVALTGPPPPTGLHGGGGKAGLWQRGEVLAGFGPRGDVASECL